MSESKREREEMTSPAGRIKRAEKDGTRMRLVKFNARGALCMSYAVALYM